jgi:homogentisate 1,2-dioxygenase
MYLKAEKDRGFLYYARLNTFVDQLFKEKWEKVFVSEDTYILFVKLRALKTNGKVKVVTELSKGEACDIVIIPKGVMFPVELNKSDYQFYICNKNINSFKNKLIK